MPQNQTPKQKKADRLLQALRRRRKAQRDDGRDRDPSTVTCTDDRVSSQDDQSNLIYFGGNYMGAPDYQESFHEQQMDRWLRSIKMTER